MEDFETWVAARSASLTRSAYLLTGDLHAAEDLLQEALARVAQHWTRLRRSGTPDAYARQVLHHLAIDRWRRRSVRPPEVLTHHAHEPTGARDGEDDTTTRLVLGDVLARLTPKQRAVLSLRFYEDLTEVQAAAVLGCSVSTVKSQTRVALARVRELAPDLLESLVDPLEAR